jgi:hypothetical protein
LGEASEETGDRRQETGDRRQETGDRRQETGDRRQETGAILPKNPPFSSSKRNDNSVAKSDARACPWRGFRDTGTVI